MARFSEKSAMAHLEKSKTMADEVKSKTISHWACHCEKVIF